MHSDGITTAAVKPQSSLHQHSLPVTALYASSGAPHSRGRSGRGGGHAGQRLSACHAPHLQVSRQERVFTAAQRTGTATFGMRRPACSWPRSRCPRTLRVLLQALVFDTPTPLLFFAVRQCGRSFSRAHFSLLKPVDSCLAVDPAEVYLYLGTGSGVVYRVLLHNLVRLQTRPFWPCL